MPGELDPKRITLVAGQRARAVVLKDRVVVASPGGKGVEVVAPERADRNVRLLQLVPRYMPTIARSLAGTAFTAAALAATAGATWAQPGDRCTRETFPVDGTPVSVTLCVPPDAKSRVAVNETFGRGSATFSRTLTLDVVPGASVTRTVDEVPLESIGSPKRLHLTIAFRDGQATVERALLLPGAVVLK